MSVHKETRADGTVVFKVRWRQGGRQRGKAFNPTLLGGKRAAERAARDFDARMARAQALGELDRVDRGKITLAEYADLWWERYALPNLAQGTLDTYSVQLDLRVIPHFGGWPLRDITPAAVEDWIATLRRRRVGDPSILKSLTVLQGILKRAVIDGEITSNPVKVVKKPRQRRGRNPRPVAPVYVERMRLALRDAGRVGDATLVALLAYAGPRPESEALTLTWPQVRHRTLLIRASKRHDAERTVPIEEPLARDLNEWRMLCGRPTDGLVFPQGDNGVKGSGIPWTGYTYDNWRHRIYQPAAAAAGLPAGARPRDLRGSYASLCIHAGLSVVEVARRLGHSAQTCLKDYADVFDEFDPTDRADVADTIRAARRAATFPPGSRDESEALAL